MISLGTDHKRGRIFILGAFYLAFVFLHLLMSLKMKGPLILADEMGYLGHARYLLGKGIMPNMEGTTFYHAGYSLLISPAFWLSSDPQKVYLAVLVINSFLISLLFLFIYYLLRNILLFSHKNAFLASLVTSLYPSFLLQSNIAWAESGITSFFLLPAILLYVTIKRNSVLWGVLLGFAIGFQYTIHARTLVLLPISGIYLAALALNRVFSARVAGASLTSLLISYLATVRLHGHLAGMGWGGGGTPSVPHLLKTFLDFNGAIKAVLVMSGQLWYLAASTYGLWILGVLVIALIISKNRSLLKGNKSPSSAVYTLTFYLLSCGGVLSTSVLFLSHYGLSEEILIYGRYNECFIALGMAVGLGMILEGKLDDQSWKRLRLVIVSMFIGLSMITLWVTANLATKPELCGFNLLGLFPILGAIRFKLQFGISMGILACTLCALIVMLCLMRVLKARRHAGIALLGSLFLMFALVQYVFLFLPGTKRVEALVLPKIIRDMPEVNAVSFDQGCREPIQLYQYQYFLPYTRFFYFDSTKE